MRWDTAATDVTQPVARRMLILLIIAGITSSGSFLMGSRSAENIAKEPSVCASMITKL